MHRALAAGQLLEPVELGLGRGQPPVEAGRRLGADPAVEQAALGGEVVPLLLHHLVLPPRRLEAGGGVAVERPGGHRGHAGAERAERRHRVGERAGHLAGQERTREQHPRADHEQAAEGHEQRHRDQLGLEPLGQIGLEPFDRAIQFGELVAGRHPLAQRGQLLRRLVDRGLHSDAPEAALNAADRPAGGAQRTLGLREFLPGGGELPRGVAAAAGPAAERAEGEREALREQHLRQRVDVDVGRQRHRHQPRQAGDPHLLAEPPGRQPGVAFGAGHVGGQPLEPRLLVGERCERRPLRPHDRLRRQVAELAGILPAKLLPALGQPLGLAELSRGRPPGVAVGMHQRNALERREPFGRPLPGEGERLDRDHAADHPLGLLGPLDAAEQRGDLGVEMGQFAPQPAGHERRCGRAREPFEQHGAAGLEGRQRRHVGVGRVEPRERRLQVREHSGHVRAVEAAGQFVEAAAAALGLERPQFVELVEPEGHHVGEGGLVDPADDVLEVVAVPGAGRVGVPGIDVVDRDQITLVAAEADHVVGIRFLGQPGEMRPLMPPLDRQQRPLGRHADEQPAGAGHAGVEHAAAEAPFEAEEDRPHELQQRRLAGLVGAVEHLHAGPQPVDHDLVQGAELPHFDAFDEHAAQPLRGAKLGLG